MNILLVMDHEEESLLFTKMLEEGMRDPFHLYHVRQINEALTILTKETVHAVLWNVQEPNAHEINMPAELIQTYPQTAFLILSHINDEALAVQAVQNGAQDFLIKGHMNGHALARAIRYAIERQRTQEQVTFQANYDQLTGLANRAFFHERLQHTLARCHRNASTLALLFLDLDHFKAINDSFGHEYGDILLKTIAHRIKKCIREVDIGVRLGGDEFVVLLDEISSITDVAAIAQRILSLIAEPVIIDYHDLHITGSIGITLYPHDSTNPQDLLKHSDRAMYYAKAQGGNTYQFYESELPGFPKLGVVSFSNQTLTQAVSHGQMLLHFQPQMNVTTRQMIGMEALIRWQHPTHGLLSPAAFIPKAEKSGLIVSLGEWVLNHVCTQAKRWEKQGFSIPPIAVNLSARQLHQKNLAGTVSRILEKTDLAPHYLRLELNENLLIKESHTTIATLTRLKAMGIQIYLDDFGTGYTSLQNLKSFPLDGIKLDQSLVQQSPGQPADSAIIQAIMTITKALGLQVIAEGVETKEHMEFLRDLGCVAMQGFWIAPPLPASQSETWIGQTHDSVLPCL